MYVRFYRNNLEISVSLPHVKFKGNEIHTYAYAPRDRSRIVIRSFTARWRSFSLIMQPVIKTPAKPEGTVDPPTLHRTVPLFFILGVIITHALYRRIGTFYTR